MTRTHDTDALARESAGERRWRPGQTASDARADFEQTTRDAVRRFAPALECVEIERGQQDGKWGEQNHDSLYWYAILGEEFGEVGKCLAEFDQYQGSADLLRYELIQVAAVAVAWVECLDRNREDA